MSNPAIIFGAGKTGRGFAAHLAHLSGYEIILVDKGDRLIAALNEAGHFDIDVLGNPDMNCAIPVAGAYNIDDDSWFKNFAIAQIAFTSVFGNNLESLALDLAKAIAFRFKSNPAASLNIITLENLTNAAGFLKQRCLQHLNEEEQQWVRNMIGFSESIVFKTCLSAGPQQDPLSVRAQDFFNLPCDADEIVGEVGLYGLQPSVNFKDQLRRKIFTYNCINALFAYLGAHKGYHYLHEAANDPEIVAVAVQAGRESCAAQIAEFHFDEQEQEAWLQSALMKFADRNMPDPIERNATDPIRKLGRDDRLIGPALLAMKHHIHPGGLIKGIFACFEYKDINGGMSVIELIHERGAAFVLQEVCGLSPKEALYALLKSQIKQAIPNAE